MITVKNWRTKIRTHNRLLSRVVSWVTFTSRVGCVGDETLEMDLVDNTTGERLSVTLSRAACEALRESLDRHEERRNKVNLPNALYTIEWAKSFKVPL